jgi:glucokinase
VGSVIIGVNLGGTTCSVSRADDSGCIESTIAFPTGSVSSTLEAVREATASLAPGPAPRFGIACGGPLDSAAGLILSPPNLPGWDRVPIVAWLVEHFGGQGYLMNDANAGALAEWQFGAGQGTQSMVFLTHGTGLGAGLILDGRLYEGTTGDAGEIGHVRLAPTGPIGYGKEGSCEGFCSGGGIARLAAGRIPGHPSPDAKEVARLAAEGVPEALAILQESGRWLGRTLAIIIDLLNPEMIVLGSIYTRSGQWLDAAMREELAREALPGPLAACRIVPSALGESLGAQAAVTVALYALPAPN